MKAAIAHVYCDYKDLKTQSEVELLSSITRQLAEQTSTMPPAVKKFCEKNAQKRRNSTDEEWISLVQSICLHFQKTYVFVDALKKVRKIMNTLLTEVHAFYTDAIMRIEDQPEESSQLAKRAISFIFSARRPLNVEELRHALAVEAEDTELDEAALPETEILLSVCAGLVGIDEKSGTAGLVHYTLQEYLEKNREKLLPEPEIEVATACLRYLSFDVFGREPCSDGEALDQRLRAYRFLDYASHHWGHHVAENQHYERIDLLFTFLEDHQKSSSAVQVLSVGSYRMNDWHNRCRKPSSPLHIIAFWGLAKVPAILFGNGLNIDNQDSHGATILQLAAKRGHNAVVQLLLQRGANVNLRIESEATALSWAARNGYKTIAELLLADRASVMTKDNGGWTALDWAVVGGNNEILKTLSDHGADIDAEFDGRNKALYLAAGEEHGL
ncbi:MAG: hypothetical protein M1818_003686 [Claussenomyces sp. TS43310]|nr:MAG: hypothetical protein M1818_003686 [Claussenomyces sp. TS43310]